MPTKEITSSDYIYDEVTDEVANNFDIDPIMVKFLMTEPFFSSIIRSLGKFKTFAIPTAGVAVRDGSANLYWNPKFVASLKPKEMIGLLKHECYHLIFNHCTTRKQDPQMMWNIAADLAINSLIDENELPEGGFVPGKAFDLTKIEDPEKLKKWTEFSNLIVSFPKGQASEWYMAQLKNDENASSCCQDMAGDAGIQIGFDDHGEWAEGMSDEQKQIVEGKIKEAVANAVKKADASNTWGSVSLETREHLRKLFSKSVDWKKVLHSFCGRRQRANKSSTHRRLNRKYPYIHPGKHRNHTSNLVVYIDQSGSVSEEEIELFFGALSSLAKKVTFTIYNFDSSVDEKSKFVWRKGKKNVKPMRTRSGGTCFDSVETHYRKIKTEYDGYLVLTDGMAARPTPCISQRCWVILPGYSLYFEPDKRDTIVVMTAKN
jgi:predicted metal-dependent peptidase